MSALPQLDSCPTDRIETALVFRDVTGKPFNARTASIRLLNRLRKIDGYLVVTLPIARLNATQSQVNGDCQKAAERYLEHSEDRFPAAVKYQSQFYIVDGHHRIVATFLAGGKDATVRLYDLDQNTQTDFPLLAFAMQPEDRATSPRARQGIQLR